MIFTLAQDIKDNVIILDIDPENDTEKELEAVSSAIEFIRYFDTYEDCFKNIAVELTYIPKKFKVKWCSSWNYEHTECDEWFEIVEEVE